MTHQKLNSILLGTAVGGILSIILLSISNTNMSISSKAQYGCTVGFISSCVAVLGSKGDGKL